jgi:FkbM family methyltransferase
MNLRHKLLLWQLKWMNFSGDDKKLKHVNISGHRVGFEKRVEMMHAYRELFIGNIYAFPASTANPLIIDCGAHIGTSVVFFKQLYPGSRIIAFEPDPESFRLLQHNTKTFQQVTLEQKAVWTHNNGVNFDNRGDMSSAIVEGEPKQGPLTPSTRLRDYLKEPVDMLKLDIEGAEVAVLYDCKDLLRNIKHLFIEFHGKADDPGKLQQVLSLLAECKMNYYIKPAHDWSPTPFFRMKDSSTGWDVQLNIFCQPA